MISGNFAAIKVGIKWTIFISAFDFLLRQPLKVFGRLKLAAEDILEHV